MSFFIENAGIDIFQGFAEVASQVDTIRHRRASRYQISPAVHKVKMLLVHRPP